MSSKGFATTTGSFLPFSFIWFSNCICQDHLVSGLIIINFLALFILGFPTTTISINLTNYYYLQIHYTKGTSLSSLTLSACKYPISWSISIYTLYISFILSLTLLCSLSVYSSYLALEDWYSYFPTLLCCTFLLLNFRSPLLT